MTEKICKTCKYFIGVTLSDSDGKPYAKFDSCHNSNNPGFFETPVNPNEECPYELWEERDIWEGREGNEL